MKTKTPEGSMDFTPTFIIFFFLLLKYIMGFFYHKYWQFQGQGEGRGI